MDAREYMNRKGIGMEHEADRPNTLEEKAWERARGAGIQRPKSGTPHDWEDWERYHNDLAESADDLEQKIDKQAHRRAKSANRPDKTRSPTGVEHYVPPASGHSPTDAKSGDSPTPHVSASESAPAPAKAEEPEALALAYIALAVLLPPLAVGLAGASGKRVALCALLTLCGWVPGVVYGLVWLKRR